MNRMEDRLDALWGEYRDACPDPEPSANFTPQLWQKIDVRRTESASVFRRMAQICVMATVALTLVIAFVLPKIQSETATYAATYVDALDAAHSSDTTVALLDGGGLQ
jgi:anti-sigma-K factor RskA